MLSKNTVYKSKLLQWDKFSSIRSRPRRLYSGDKAGYAYPLDRQPIVTHDLVRARGDDIVWTILLHSAYKFMLDIAYVEVELINHTAQRIYNKTIDFNFSKELRHDMLSIIVDEAYHAYVAIDFVNQVEQATNIKPIVVKESVELRYAIDKYLPRIPLIARDAFEVIAIAIGENTLTKELFTMVKQKELNPFFQQVMADHMIDEGRHSSIFRDVMRIVWDHLDEELRLIIGRILPEFIVDYLDPAIHIAYDRKILSSLDFNNDEIETIITDTHRVFNIGRLLAENPVAENIVDIVNRCGILCHEPTYQAFLNKHLINEESSVEIL